MYLFVAVAWIVSLFFGVGVLPENWLYLEKMAKLLVFIFLFSRVVTSMEEYRYVMWTLIVCGVFLAFQAHVVSAGHFVGDRLEAIGGIDFTESNGFASFLALVITFLGVELLYVGWPRTIIYVFAISLMLNAMIMTKSRSVFLGLLIAVPYVIFRSPRGYRKKVFVSVLFGAILFASLVDMKFVKRIGTIQTAVETRRGEVLNRLEIWKVSMPMFLDHPMGVGVKNFEKLLPTYGPFRDMDAHNTYVLCYSELGIFGITLFLIIIGETLIQVRRIRIAVRGTPYDAEISLGAFRLEAALVTYLVGYMTSHSTLYSEMLWILLVLPIYLENAARKLLMTRNPL